MKKSLQGKKKKNAPYPTPSWIRHCLVPGKDDKTNKEKKTPDRGLPGLHQTKPSILETDIAYINILKV